MSRIILSLKEQFQNNIDEILKEIKIAYKIPKTLFKCPKFILGVSGGPDSMAMLYLFYNLSLHKDIKLFVAHYNHMVRKEEAMRDEQFVIDVCEKLNIKIITGRLKEKKEKVNEEYLRKKRFSFFKSLARREKPCFIALAHTKDDNLETVFMNLLQGKISKLSLGIKPWIKLEQIEDSFLIHPLINIPKRTILDFIMESNIPYVIDSSNLNDNYLRNYIRHKIFPLFTRYRDSFFFSLENVQKIWEEIKKTQPAQRLPNFKVKNA